MKTDKATHEPINIELFAPVMKEAKGKYIAVLSDTSIDRDGERVGKSALTKIISKGGYIAALVDHENKVLNQVAQWTNMQLKEIDGHTALIAEPKFFPSNKKAQEIKGMLDEGAELGISIGAIVKEYEDEKIEGKSMRTFTDLELLEASFVAIPSNRHGKAMLAMAKSFKIKGGQTMTEITQKDIDLAVEKSSEEFTKKVDNLEKQLVEKDTEIATLHKEVEDSEKAKEESEKEKEESDKKAEESEKKAKLAEAETESAKKKSLEKQKFLDEESKKQEESVDKEFKDGKVPIMRT